MTTALKKKLGSTAQKNSEEKQTDMEMRSYQMIIPIDTQFHSGLVP
jgi:hypothetical protein